MECEHELVRSFGGVWTDDDAMSIVGFDLLNAAAVIKRRAGLPIEPQQIVDHLAAAVLARIRRHVPWRPGARELLESLNAAGVPCAMVTMSWQDIANEVLLHLPPRTFQAVITGDMVANGKPHPEPYRRAAAALGVDPVSCVAIEDSPTGVPARPRPPGAWWWPCPTTCRSIRRPAASCGARSSGSRPNCSARSSRPRRCRPPAHPSPPAPAGGDDRPRRGGGLALWWQRVLGGGWRSLGALATVLVLIGVGVWWFAIRDTTPPYRPGRLQRAHVGAVLDARRRHAGPRRAGQRLPPGVAVLVPHVRSRHLRVRPQRRRRGAAAGRRLHRRRPPARRADHHLAVRQHRPGGDGGDPRRPGDSGPSTSTRSPTSPPSTTSRASTSTTRTSPSRTTAAPGGRRAPTGWRSSQELGARLHADGRILTVTVPADLRHRPVPRQRLLGLRLRRHRPVGRRHPHHGLRQVASTTPGPIAPLDWVTTIVDAATKAAGGPEKLVLGIPLYGRNWVVSTTGTCPDDAPGTTADLPQRRSTT